MRFHSINQRPVAAFLIAASLAAAPAAALAAEKGGSTGSPKVTFTATGTFSDGTSRVLIVRTDEDSDGDGRPDEGELRVVCSGPRAVSATFTPRDAASGLATGRRQYQPLLTRSGATYRGSWDLKEAKGARTASPSASVTVVLDSTGPNVCV